MAKGHLSDLGDLKAKEKLSELLFYQAVKIILAKYTYIKTLRYLFDDTCDLLIYTVVMYVTLPIVSSFLVLQPSEG